MNITGGVIAAGWTMSMIGAGNVIGQATHEGETSSKVARTLGIIGVAGGLMTAFTSAGGARAVAGISAAGIGAGLVIGASD